jgi:hypothetical protein
VNFDEWKHENLVRFAAEAWNKIQIQQAEIDQLRADLRVALDAYRREVNARKAD